MVICSLTALATGTSWGAAGTTGIAMMGIGQGLGVPAPITAGAVLSMAATLAIKCHHCQIRLS